ncbi:MAG: NUDIX hydrolase [Chlamydiales bacterium]|nr:NUDIX hydrolase [Chlamydiales bacterium]
MKRLSIIFFLFLVTYLRATTYEQVTKAMGDTGNSEDGEIEILVDEASGLLASQKQKERYLKKGFDEEFASRGAQVGKIMEDLYWILVRDPVRFPNGALGTYNRLLWKNNLSGISGIVVLPLNEKNKILLNVNYRHATRSWEIELPRGCREEKETTMEAAQRELVEETGAIAKDLVFLGDFAPDTGSLCTVLSVFLVKYDTIGATDCEFSEAIDQTIVLSLQEIESLMLNGKMNISIKGKEHVAYMRDPSLFFAIYQAKLRSLL